MEDYTKINNMEEMRRTIKSIHQEADKIQPYYQLWIKHNRSIDPCWQGDAFSGHEYIIWINGQWDKYFNGNRPAHITKEYHQLFLVWLTRKDTRL